MPAIGARAIKNSSRRKLTARGKNGREEVERVVMDMADEAQQTMEEIVSDWDHKPSFAQVRVIGPNSIEVHVEPIGPEAKKWEWTSRGTKPHLILPVRKKQLVFKRDYSPRTTPGNPPTWGGPGKSSGDTVFSKGVRHPGTRGRKFEEYIREKMKREFSRNIENAFKRGLRR